MAADSHEHVTPQVGGCDDRVGLKTRTGHTTRAEEPLVLGHTQGELPASVERVGRNESRPQPHVEAGSSSCAERCAA